MTEREDWRTYQATGCECARERLVERHVPLVRYFARRLAESCGDRLDREEMVSAGLVGLLDAVEAFDPARGCRFSTFAAPRIRGAMLDEVRRRDDASRTVRKRQRQVADAEDRLAGHLNRPPRHREVAEVLGVDVRTLWAWKADAAQAVTLSLEDRIGEGGRDARRLRDVVEWAGEDVEDLVARRQEVDRLRVELDGLDEREKLVLKLYDFEEMKLREIAEMLEVTESRVSQIRTRAIGRLRDRMGDLRAVAA